MRQLRVLVSGGGIAGPALALCLARRGWRTTVLESAPALRTGGQAVDFRGPVHRAVLERLDLWDAIRARRTNPLPLRMLDRAERVVATMPELMLAGDVEILRGDLSALLHERASSHTEVRFGERIVGLTEHAAGVDVELASGTRETWDVVVGADGLHSGVRRLVFGDGTDAARLVHHGYRIATYAVRGRFAGDAVTMTSEPGRAVMIAPTASGARTQLVWVGGPLGEGERDAEVQRRALATTFAGMTGAAARAVAALAEADDLWVDAIASTRVARWATSRVALLGDAAWGGTLGGMGTPLAIIGAWVLAGELLRGDAPSAAFARYEARMRPYALRGQKGAARVGSFFAPKTRVGLWLRNAMYAFLTSPRMLGFFERMVTDAATDFVLPEYAV